MAQFDFRSNKSCVYYQGEHYTITALAKKVGMVHSTLRRKLAKGIPLEEAIQHKTGKSRGSTAK